MSSSPARKPENGHGHSHAAAGHGHSHAAAAGASNGHHDDDDHDHDDHDEHGDHDDHDHEASPAKKLLGHRHEDDDEPLYDEFDDDDDDDSGENRPLIAGLVQSSMRAIPTTISPLVFQCVGKDSKVTDAEARTARNKLLIAIAICTAFMIGEIVGGVIASSLALMTDAAHLLSDVAGFLISLFALYLARKKPTSSLSFGFHRAEILGALLSVAVIWILTGVLVVEAIDRIQNPEVVDGKLMFIVAIIGLVCNVTMGFTLHQDLPHGHSHGGGHGHGHGSKKKAVSGRDAEEGHGHAHGNINGDKHGHAHGGEGHDDHHDDDHHDDGHHDDDDDHHGHAHGGGHGHAHGGGHGHAHGKKAVQSKKKKSKKEENINVRAAQLHVLGDMVQSVGVVIASVIIWIKPEWHIADPLCTFLFSILVLFSTVGLVRDALHILMEGVPAGIQITDVKSELMGVKGVVSVHDLHIWSLTTTKVALAVHLEIDRTVTANEILVRADQVLCSKFDIHHTTIQIEQPQPGPLTIVTGLAISSGLPSASSGHCNGKSCGDDL